MLNSGGGGPAPKAVTRVAAPTPPPRKHLDIFKGAPRRLPEPLSDQFPVRARVPFVYEPSLCLLYPSWLGVCPFRHLF